MVKKITVMLVDDIDGKSPAEESVGFAIDGVSYEIDLSSKNAAGLRRDLKVWINAARRIGGRQKGRAVGRGRASGRGESAAIREWARRSGHDVASRGRIPADIVDAFRAAH
jgi:hypothetical protein